MKRFNAFAAPLRAALSALLLGACALSLSTAVGQTPNPPERMTYQGFLVGSDGVALGNAAPKNYDVVFRIYSSESGGNPDLLWSEQQTVTVDKGYFSVLLGEGSQVGSETRNDLSTVFKGSTASDRFVAITVNGIGVGGANVEILPRLRLLTSPYAFLAKNAVKLVQDNAAGADLITSSGNQVIIDGRLDIRGDRPLEFGAGLTKDPSAGKIGYGTFSNGDSLDIVGAGTEGNNRKVQIWAEGGLRLNGSLDMNGNISAGGYVSASNFYGNGSGLSGVARTGDANVFQYDNTFNGHVRVGEYVNGSGGSGYGEALILSGAPAAIGYNSDNSDPLWLARFNIAANTTEFRINVGDDPGSADKLVIGATQGGGGNFTQGGTWYPQVTFDMRGLVGIGNNSPGYAIDIRNNDPRIQMAYPDGASFSQVGRTVNTVFIGLNNNVYTTAFRWASYDGDANWDFYSDRKLKKDIVDAEPMLDRALQVQVRRFHWKDSPENSKLQLGVIAQELQPLFPSMVGEMEDPNTHENAMTVGYGDFAVIAIKAIQELKARHDAEMAGVKAQVAELADLKAQVAEMKNQLAEVLRASSELRAQAEKSKVTASVGR